MYIEEAGTCAATTQVVDFTYPETEQRICFLGKSYRQVKNLPGTAIAVYQNDDNLAGTSVVGVEGNKHQEWQISFANMSHETFLFKSGNGINFVIANKNIRDVSGSSVQTFEVIQSSEH